jgi:hypothetical protein
MKEKHGVDIDYYETRNPSFVQFHLTSCNFQTKFDSNNQIVGEVD